MAQKTDLNVNPYFDDFDRAKNFYKVLFKPGYPVQARELTTLQSTLQNQIQSFGSYIFKDGTVVSPGNITYDNQFYSVKLNSSLFGIDISTYIDNFVGKKITGQTSGSTAKLQYVAYPDGGEVEDITIYVKYVDSNDNFVFDPFEDGESLIADENIVYGNTTITAGTPFASLIASEATSTGSSASIGAGTYFIRGFFAEVSQQTIILDNYTNTPSYRVGLKIEELLVNAKDDNSLYDNAKGFSNYAAPGADRLKINLTLTKKDISDKNDTDFVELLRVKDGRINKIEAKTQLSRLGDYIAERTYEESGHYALENFGITLHNSLNNKLGNDGLFFDTQFTDEQNSPSDDLMCVKVSPGEAYVGGVNIEKPVGTILDIEKPRDVESSTSNVPFEMGNLLRVNNVYGTARQRGEIELYDKPFGLGGSKIGDARVYTFSLSGDSYQDASTNWDLYLYDVQTYTTLTLNTPVSGLGLVTSTFIKGKSSGASGYAIDSGTGNTVSIRQTSGTFSAGEQLIISGIDASATAESVTIYATKDIKSVFQAASGDFTEFRANTVLDSFNLPNGIVGGTISGGNTLESPGKIFTGVKVGDIIRYQTTSGDETFNEVTAVSNSSLTIGIGTTVPGVSDGSVTNGTYASIKLGYPVLRNREQAYLYVQLPEQNIQSVDLSGSTLEISDQIVQQTTNASGQLTFDLSALSGITSAFYKSFDEERYSVHYSNGGIGTITSDSFSLTNNEVTIEGLLANQTGDVTVNVTLIKNSIQSKIKEYTRSTVIDVIYSRNSNSGSDPNNSINDGLTYNSDAYGLRVQDEEISLNYPDVVKVLAIYESLGTSEPVLDSIQFADSSIVSNAIIGENIISSANNVVARVVTKGINTVQVVYLNQDRFIAGQNVVFEESNSSASILSITLGSYRDITQTYVLDKGQKEQYYDYSKIVRGLNTPTPSRRLKIIFDHYVVPSSDNGDVFTILSYDDDRFLEDIPEIGSIQVRASDTLDFRPRVPQFTDTNRSPFDFGSRVFGSVPKFILKPKEESILGYTYYLPRTDKIFLDLYGNFVIEKGISSRRPVAPVNTNPDQLMELGTIDLPPYLYDPSEAIVNTVDNRRYTMRDIGKLEDRIETLENITSLSLLELNTQTLQVQDAQGNNRFKTGFFVDDFKDNSFVNQDFSSVQVDTENQELQTISSINTLEAQIAPAQNISDEELDLTTNFDLLDSNVQKSGSAVTLKYDSVPWIEQPLATRVENVNPFNVVVYNGTVKLSPKRDTWVRIIRLADRTVRRNIVRTVQRRVQFRIVTQTFQRPGRFGGGTWQQRRRVPVPPPGPVSSVSVSSRDVLVSSGIDRFMRSRNTTFNAKNLKPLTRFYQFFDGNGNVDFIPKLIEISPNASLTSYGALGTFRVGETVIGYKGGRKISFRVARANHKEGPYNAPEKVFNINPYVKTENLSSAYSQSTKALNVDIYALSAQAQGKYSGYLEKGMKLVGQTSGAVAYVKDLRLISDNYGDLIGSFFLRNPFVSPPPAVRIGTGTKTFKLTNSPTNAEPLPGSKLQSTAERTYSSLGRYEVRQRVRTITTTTTITRVRRGDPLAQSFSVGDGSLPDSNGQPEDANGAFLTAVDLFFANKPATNDPVRIEVRTVELGTPTLNVLGEPVILTPDQVNVSRNGEVATKVTFEYPIYLAPGEEYAIVALAETSDDYELWIAEMGEKTINTQSLPNAEAVIYSKQFSLGSLFKSQNGSIWTANQYQDLKFKLYKANFTSDTGTAFFYNPTLDESNGYVENLEPNPLVTLSRNIALGITTDTDYSAVLSAGRQISGSNGYGYGFIDAVGGEVSNCNITNSGTNYPTGTFNNLETTTIVGDGSGLRLSVTASGGSITAIAATTANGNGYVVGDVVGIVTSLGAGARFTIGSINGTDTLYLTNVQGERGAGKAFQVGAALSYYNDSGDIVSLGSTTITDRTSGGDNLFSGNYISVSQFDHGMYSGTDRVVLSDIEPNSATSALNSPLTIDEVSTISIANTSGFDIFEGQNVSASYPGYVSVGDEIIEYNGVGSGTLSISGSGRAKDNTISQPHEIGTQVYKYELSGVSMRRINNVESAVSLLENSIDGYHVEIDMSTNGNDRSSDGSTSGAPRLAFESTESVGGNSCKSTKNIQFNEIVPYYEVITPSSSTSVSASVRTITGRSVDGSEIPFIDNGFEAVQLNQTNKLNSVRMVASKVNETARLSSLPRNKSLTTAIRLTTKDSNLSPIIFTEESTTEFRLDRLNRPVTNYVTDNRSNSFNFDPHSAVYVSNTVNLTQPATSLKVILAAYRHESADIRVLYNLIREDSSEVEQEFELFPGYDNLTLTADGLQVVNPANNSGRPDTFIPASLDDQYLEYEFTANNLDLFTGYSIKIVMSGTNQAYAPRIKDLRTISLI